MKGFWLSISSLILCLIITVLVLPEKSDAALYKSGSTSEGYYRYPNGSLSGTKVVDDAFKFETRTRVEEGSSQTSNVLILETSFTSPYPVKRAGFPNYSNGESYGDIGDKLIGVPDLMEQVSNPEGSVYPSSYNYTLTLRLPYTTERYERKFFWVETNHPTYGSLIKYIQSERYLTILPARYNSDNYDVLSSQPCCLSGETSVATLTNMYGSKAAVFLRFSAGVYYSYWGEIANFTEAGIKYISFYPFIYKIDFNTLDREISMYTNSSVYTTIPIRNTPPQSRETDLGTISGMLMGSSTMWALSPYQYSVKYKLPSGAVKLGIAEEKNALYYYSINPNTGQVYRRVDGTDFSIYPTQSIKIPIGYEASGVFTAKNYPYATTIYAATRSGFGISRIITPGFETDWRNIGKISPPLDDDMEFVDMSYTTDSRNSINQVVYSDRIGLMNGVVGYNSSVYWSRVSYSDRFLQPSNHTFAGLDWESYWNYPSLRLYQGTKTEVERLPDNKKPNTPVVTVNPVVNTLETEISWTFTDPDTGDEQEKYQIQLSNTSDFTTNIWDSGITSGKDLKRVVTGYVEGVNYIRVRVYDGTDWSDWGKAEFTYIRSLEVVVSTYSDNINNKYLADTGDTVYVKITFSNTVTSNPVVRIGGEIASVTKYGGDSFLAKKTITWSTSNLIGQQVSMLVKGITMDNGQKTTDTEFTTDSLYVLYGSDSFSVSNILVQSDNPNSIFYVGPKNTVVITFTVDKNLLFNPRVTVGGRVANFSSLSGNTYKYTTKLDETVREGKLKIEITNLTGVDGIKLADTNYTSNLVYDRTPAIVTNLRFTSPTSNLSVGDAVSLSFTTNEPIVGLPKLVFDGRYNATITKLSSQSFSSTYTLQSGSIDFILSNLEDLSGNITPDIDGSYLDNGTQIETVGPISIVITMPKGGSPYTGNPIVLFSASSKNGDIVELKATINGKSYTSGKPIKQTGELSLRVTAKDEVGNEEVKTVEFTIN